MSHNMSIYRRLNPRLLICLIYISNTLPQTQCKSSMKAWGLINMRKSLGDALKNAFEETTMKNMPIDQFQSFKWRNGVQNWNLREKLSNIGPYENFDFWSKLTCPGSKSTDTWSGSILSFPGHSQIKLQRRWLILMTWRWRGLRLTWTCLRGCWRGVITSSGDVKWHQ